MDKTIRALLSVAVAILYPIVVYFAVVTVMPRSEASQYPTYPSCVRERYDSFNRRYISDSSCEKQYDEYDRKVRVHNDAQREDSKKDVTRAQVALVIALITIIGSIFLKDIKELMAGLTFGAMVAIIGAVSVIAENSGDAAEVANAMLILLSFCILTAVLYTTEKWLPPPPPAKPAT